MLSSPACPTIDAWMHCSPWNGRTLQRTFSRRQSTTPLRTMRFILRTASLSRHLSATNRTFQLSSYSTTRRRPDGSCEISISMGETLHGTVGAVDIVIRDAAGSVTSDTRADRIKATNEFAELAAKHRHDPVAAALLNSFNEAMNDPSNEGDHRSRVCRIGSIRFCRFFGIERAPSSPPNFFESASRIS